MTPERARKIAKDCADSWYGGASGLSLKEAITQGILEACQEIEGDLVATRAERDTYRQDLADARALLQKLRGAARLYRGGGVAGQQMGNESYSILVTGHTLGDIDAALASKPNE